jgi:hypothetical protein
VAVLKNRSVTRRTLRYSDAGPDFDVTLDSADGRSVEAHVLALSATTKRWVNSRAFSLGGIGAVDPLVVFGVACSVHALKRIFNELV